MTSSGPMAGRAGTTFPRRFYKAAAIVQGTDGFALLLDDKPARTPARNPLALPTSALAQAVAEEWAAVGDFIDPRAMPMTRLVNSVIDGVSRTEKAVREEILRYAGSDLVAYRAPDPAELVLIQRAAWDPVLAWAQDRFGASFSTATGVVFVDQPPELATHLGRALDEVVGSGREAPFRLGALHVMTTLMGSTLLALAVGHGRLRADEAWSAAHVDEDFQITRWGSDEDAAQRRALRLREMETAARILTLLKS